jgi:hypothetical protein
LYTKTRSISRPTSEVASISKGKVEQSVKRRVLRIFGQERDSSAHSFVIFLSYDHYHITTKDTGLYTKTRSITRPTSDIASISKEKVEQSVKRRVLRFFGRERDAPTSSIVIFFSYNHHHFTTKDPRLYTKTTIFLAPLRMKLFQVRGRQCKELNDISLCVCFRPCIFVSKCFSLLRLMNLVFFLCFPHSSSFVGDILCVRYIVRSAQTKIIDKLGQVYFRLPAKQSKIIVRYLLEFRVLE